MHTEHVETGRTIQQRTGKTFHLATRLLPERVRHPTYVLYGFFRIADEVVDDPDGTPPEAQLERLESIRAQALGEAPASDPIVEAFCSLRERHDIPDAEVDAFVDAMRADVHTDRYETVADLEAYVRGSAAAVGVMMTAVMAPEDESTAIPHARALGEAFQLTNFVRDVREDVLDRDRIYLPLETLRSYGVSADQIRRLEYTPAVGRAVAAELRRAEVRYREGVAGIRHLPDDCQFPVLLAAVLYAEHHRLIRSRDYDVLSDRPTLSTARMLWCLARTRWHWQWNRDPDVVFRRVAAIPSGESTRPDPEPGGGVPVQ